MSNRESVLRPTRTTVTLAFAATAVALALGPAPVSAQVQLVDGGTGVTSSGPTDQWRLNAYGVLRGGGSWRVRDDGSSLSRSIGVGGGVGLRVEIPIHDYVVIGPLLDFRVLTPGQIFGVGPDRINALNFGVWSKGRYRFDASGHPLEVYIGIPMGLTFYFSDAAGWDTEVGVSVGLMFGGQLFINDRIGFMFETGFRRDGFRDNGAKFRTLQFVMNAGISIAL